MKLLYAFVCILCFPFAAYTQCDNWEQLKDFPGDKRSQATAFSMDGYGYLCLGREGNYYKQDLWRYDAQLNTWKKMADFPGVARLGAVAFVVNEKAYVGGGWRNTSLRDFYMYDPANDKWTAIDSMPGNGIYQGGAFSIGHRGFVGGGYTYSFSKQVVTKDFYEYNTITGKWKQIADHAGAARADGVAFSAGGNGYYGLGANVNLYKDLYRYDTLTGKWTQMEDCPYTKFNSVSLVMNDTVYIVTGKIAGDPYVTGYDVKGDEWFTHSFTQVDLTFAAGFVLGNRGYIATGHKYNKGDYAEMWYFAPEVRPVKVDSVLSDPPACYGDAATIDIYAKPNRSYFECSIDSGKTFGTSSIFSLVPGRYVVAVRDTIGCTVYGSKFSFTEPPLSDTVIVKAICKGDSVHFLDHYVKAGGTYKDTLLNRNGCDSFITLTLTVYDRPDVSLKAPEEDGFKRRFGFEKNSNEAVDSFIWDFGDGATDDENISPLHTYAAKGEYEVCLITTNTCGSDTDCITIHIELTAMPDTREKELNIYPNPARDILTIEAPGTHIPQPVHISDVLGQNRWQGLLSNGRIIIDVSGFADGIYFLHYGSQVRRIVVSR